MSCRVHADLVAHETECLLAPGRIGRQGQSAEPRGGRLTRLERWIRSAGPRHATCATIAHSRQPARRRATSIRESRPHHPPPRTGRARPGPNDRTFTSPSGCDDGVDEYRRCSATRSATTTIAGSKNASLTVVEVETRRTKSGGTTTARIPRVAPRRARRGRLQSYYCAGAPCERSRRASDRGGLRARISVQPRPDSAERTGRLAASDVPGTCVASEHRHQQRLCSVGRTRD